MTAFERRNKKQKVSDESETLVRNFETYREFLKQTDRTLECCFSANSKAKKNLKSIAEYRLETFYDALTDDAISSSVGFWIYKNPSTLESCLVSALDGSETFSSEFSRVVRFCDFSSAFDSAYDGAWDVVSSPYMRTVAVSIFRLLTCRLRLTELSAAVLKKILQKVDIQKPRKDAFQRKPLLDDLVVSQLCAEFFELQSGEILDELVKRHASSAHELVVREIASWLDKPSYRSFGVTCKRFHKVLSSETNRTAIVSLRFYRMFGEMSAEIMSLKTRFSPECENSREFMSVAMRAERGHLTLSLCEAQIPVLLHIHYRKSPSFAALSFNALLQSVAPAKLTGLFDGENKIYDGTYLFDRVQNFQILARGDWEVGRKLFLGDTRGDLFAYLIDHRNALDRFCSQATLRIIFDCWKHVCMSCNEREILRVMLLERFPLIGANILSLIEECSDLSLFVSFVNREEYKYISNEDSCTGNFVYAAVSLYLFSIGMRQKHIAIRSITEYIETLRCSTRHTQMLYDRFKLPQFWADVLCKLTWCLSISNFSNAVFITSRLINEKHDFVADNAELLAPTSIFKVVEKLIQYYQRALRYSMPVNVFFCLMEKYRNQDFWCEASISLMKVIPIGEKYELAVQMKKLGLINDQFQYLLSRNAFDVEAMKEL